MERMTCGFGEVKLAGSESAEMAFSGYGAVFGNVDAHGDVIVPGAFADTLASARKSGQWPAMLMQHGGMLGDDMTPIGVWLELAEDGHGLKAEGKLAGTPRGREAYELLKMAPRPALNGLSIGYIAKEYEHGTKPTEPRRTLKKIELMEISLVTFPANQKARVRSVKAAELTEREFERLLMQDAGLSRSEARALMRGGLKALNAMQDAGGELRDIAEALQRNTAILLQT